MRSNNKLISRLDKQLNNLKNEINERKNPKSVNDKHEEENVGQKNEKVIKIEENEQEDEIENSQQEIENEISIEDGEKKGNEDKFENNNIEYSELIKQFKGKFYAY